MKITIKKILIRELLKKYDNKDEEGGVWAYNTKLNVRPPYQREFIYKAEKRNAVINSIVNGFPLNLMYWEERKDGAYGLMDGQQRIISICEYLRSKFSIDGKFFHNLTKEVRNKILDYELLVCFCVGTEKEILDHIIVINTQGEQMNKQEMRNVVYTGTWLTDAKKHFSKRNCPAQDIGGNYLKGSSIRQDFLEIVISWISNRQIEEYMGKNQHKSDAKVLWKYFQKVINWVEKTFPKYRGEMKCVSFGTLYNEFKNKPLNPTELEKEISKLMEDEDVDNKKGIYQYVLTRDEKYLNIRAFSDKDKREVYERQKGFCAKCKKHFEIEEMEAHHIKEWSKGGQTIPLNCVILCKDCHNKTKSGL